MFKPPQGEPTLRELTDAYLEYLLHKYGNKTKVAEVAEISQRTIYNRLPRFKRTFLLPKDNHANPGHG